MKMEKGLRRLRDYSAVWLVGSAGYSLLEILWRGFTHWTMAVTGGLCFFLLYRLNLRRPREGVLRKCLRGTFAVTAVEFLVGCVVNRLLKWQVWDYSGRFGNLLGQVCPLYTGLWFLLCIPVYGLAGLVRKLLARM